MQKNDEYSLQKSADPYIKLSEEDARINFNFQDSEEDKLNFQLDQNELVSFSEDKLTTQSFINEAKQDQMQSQISQRTEFQALKDRQQEILLKTINFNILVVGLSGTGKTTFINTLFSQTCFTNRQTTLAIDTLKIVENTALLRRKDFKVQLTMSDLEGYKTHACIRNWVKQVKAVITTQYRLHKIQTKNLYQSKEVYQSQKKKIVDDRSHACLYFINGPQITQEDLFAIKHLSQIISVIPILAKGDSYTKQEQINAKLLIIKSFKEYNIECYDCLRSLPEHNFYRSWLIKENAPPFVIVSSESQLQEKQGRTYPWGFCDVWNPNHSDLQILQKLLIEYYSLDMIEMTEFYQCRFTKRRQQKKIQRQKLQEQQQTPLRNILKIVILNVVKFLQK